jgi:ApbE superfamily uncharacterized protein (UPF0280 family)
LALRAQLARLSDGRWHLSDGPIDVILSAFGNDRAEAAALALFPGILDGLVAELPLLRAPFGAPPAGPVARRMWAACQPFARQGIWVTPMAAVAGAVADALLAAMRDAAPELRRAFVNDGGDIAVHLAPGERLAIGMVADPRWPVPDGALRLAGGDGVGGVATSGRHGRSFSFGIADAVTVLAADAATADAAATLIGNAVDVQSPAIRRAPAESLDPDSDLGARLVTVGVDRLTEDEVAAALAAGAARARHWVAAGLIRAAALRLQGSAVSVP